MASELNKDSAWPGGPLRDVRHLRVNEQYTAWLRNNRLRATDKKRMRAEQAGFGYRPLVSLVIPVYDPEETWLELALDSVLSQVYPRWELCICDDASTKDHVREILARYERLDSRIKVKHLEQNRGISGASNEALSLATGEFVGLLDHDDELTPDALFQVVSLLQEYPEADLVYTDEDKMDEEGNRLRPTFKPDWSPDLLLNHNYITHFSVFREKILGEIGGFREGTEGSQDYDLILRFTERTRNIHHIHKILYHWRMVEGSTALSSAGKGYTHERSRRILEETMERRGLKGSVEDGHSRNFLRVKLDIQGSPKVSIVMPTRDNLSLLKNCVESIERLTSYRNYEILIVDNDSSDPQTLEYLSSIPHQVIHYEGAFSHSGVNNLAASYASGEYLLFLNDDTEVISGEWLDAMLRHAQRPDVGAVGAKLLYSNDRIQHAGLFTGVGGTWNPGVAAHSHQYYPANSTGYKGALETDRNYNAVTGACMMVRRAVFEEVGGFDEENLPIAFNDVDLCLKLRTRGYVLVYTPDAKLYHHEAASRGYGNKPEELQTAEYMKRRWGSMLADDPYYNRNFSRGGGDFYLRADELRPRILRAELEGAIEGSGASNLKQQDSRGSDRTTLLPSPLKEPAKNSASPQRTGAASTHRASVDTEQFIWMFGAPRTGSTWLSRMMGELENQQVWAEPLIGMMFGSLIHGSLKNNQSKIASPNFIMGEPYREVWLDSMKRFITDGATARYPELGRDEYLVIKEPNGSEGAPLVMSATPESKMIFLVRDSRDAVASRLDANKKGSWGQQRGVEINWEYDTAEKLNMYTKQAAEQYQELISLVGEAYERHPGKKILVRYEDLRRDPYTTLRGMYEALELEVDEVQLRAAVEKHSWEQIPETDKGIGQFYRKAQPGGWEEDLSAEQIRMIEEATAPMLSKYYHYEPQDGRSGDKPQPWESNAPALEPFGTQDHSNGGVRAARDGVEPFFIVGHGRSGTTWLQNILDSHPEIVCKGEGMFFGRSISLNKRAQNLHAALASSEELKTWHDRRVWTSGKFEDYLPAFVRSITEPLLLEELSKNPGAKVVGDKTPHYVFVLDEVRSIYPEARIIHILRDGRDVVLSNLFNTWNRAEDRGGAAKAPPEVLEKRDRFFADPEAFLARESIFTEEMLRRVAQGWSRTVHKGLEDGQEMFGEKCVQVKYEDLLQAPVEHVQRLLSFLDVSDEEDLISSMIEENSFEKMSGGRQRGDDDPNSFFRKGLAGDWKNYFTERDKQIFKNQAGDALIRLGYETDLDW